MCNDNRTQNYAACIDEGRSLDGRDPRVKVPTLIVAALWTVVALSSGLFIAAPASAKAPRSADPCDRKELSVDDVRDFLTGKPTINHYSMSEGIPGEGCSIGVTGNGWAFVDISVREGDLQSFQNLIVFVAPPRTSVPGIGDEAISTATKESNVPNARETDLFVRKGRLQCIAQLHRSSGAGEKLVVPQTDSAIVGKLGGLCKKLFAAHAGA